MTRHCLADSLWALNAVLVVGCTLARDEAPHEELEFLIKAAAGLPLLLLSDTDETAFFLGALDELAEKFPAIDQARRRFDGAGQRFSRTPREPLTP